MGRNRSARNPDKSGDVLRFGNPQRTIQKAAVMAGPVPAIDVFLA
jgi:hypothetical protein